MEPQFQSSFIPKNSASTAGGAPVSRLAKQRDLFSFLAVSIFALSVILAGGVFLYKSYLNYHIAQMGLELENARASLQPETVTELTRLNARLVSTESLLNSHKIISPIFSFLESFTPKSVRYTDFSYNTSNKGLELMLKGEARGYTALAAAAEVFNENKAFQEPSFSDLRLDEKGNVVFTLSLRVDPTFLSYKKLVETVGAPAPAPNFFSATSTNIITSTTTISSTTTR